MGLFSKYVGVRCVKYGGGLVKTRKRFVLKMIWKEIVMNDSAWTVEWTRVVYRDVVNFGWGVRCMGCCYKVCRNDGMITQTY